MAGMLLAQAIAWTIFSWNLAGAVAATKHHPRKEPRLWFSFRWVLHLLFSLVIYFAFARPFIINS
ncbi:MAG: hypothetical protein P4L77_10680 [Sulfuriferula sp.]|nr:hypothetical protein [Sulfuriferula sp.]